MYLLFVLVFLFDGLYVLLSHRLAGASRTPGDSPTNQTNTQGVEHVAKNS
jgi:hypothetical protein